METVGSERRTMPITRRDDADRSATLAQLALALSIVLVAASAIALHGVTFVTEPAFRAALISTELWSELSHCARSRPVASILFVGVAASWPVGALVLAWLRRVPLSVAAWRWGMAYLWLFAYGLFELIWTMAASPDRGVSLQRLGRLLDLLGSMHTVALGGWLASGVVQAVPLGRLRGIGRMLACPGAVGVAAVLFAACFAWMSVRQFDALLVPHGDSAMYEEHLWNLVHGKGFRSQLDGGRLFFGEHLEVVHVLLLPIYVVWPSLATLNVVQCAALASGALAVRGLTTRLAGSAATANGLAIAYLLYAPMQYLLLEASLKTYRPENLAVPLLLFALWALEASRYRTMLVLLGVVILAKEDYAIVTAMVGAYLAVRRCDVATRRSRGLGLGVFGFSLAYLWFVLVVFIPHFRGGPPHYTAYFAELGKSPQEIVLNLIRDPEWVVNRVSTWANLVFVAALTLPLAGLPLFGIGRIWVLLPSLGMLLLSRREGMNTVLFHFHAPLVPILLWAAAEGAGRLVGVLNWWHGVTGTATIANVGPAGDAAGINAPSEPCARSPAWVGWAAVATALVSGALQGKSPLSLTFFDPHAGLRGFGLVLYGVNVRSVNFPRIEAMIPTTASVAATDYLRPRFTHHRECHQWGEGGLKPGVDPRGIDYIVIDLTGPNSDPIAGAHSIDVLPNRETWETVHLCAQFLVLRARRAPQ